MRVGISLTSRHDVADSREGARWMIERQDGCARYGRQPAAVAIRRDVYVGESAAEAESVGQAMVRAGYRGFDPAALVWGSVEQVVDKLRPLGLLGYTDIIVRHLTNNHPRVLGSLGRLAEVRRALQHS